MRLIVVLLVVLAPGLAWAAPPFPGNVTIANTSVGQTGVGYTVTWSAAPFATSYRWNAAYNDGQAAQNGTTTALNVGFIMPYHTSGKPSSGYVCVQSVDASGAMSPEAGCAGFTVPAPPPPVGNVPLNYLEPSKKTDGKPLNDLKEVRLYYILNGAAEKFLTFPASSPSGGAAKTQTLATGLAGGTLTGAMTSVNTTGGESARTAMAPYTWGGGPSVPQPAGPGSVTIAPEPGRRGR